MVRGHGRLLSKALSGLWRKRRTAVGTRTTEATWGGLRHALRGPARLLPTRPGTLVAVALLGPVALGLWGLLLASLWGLD